MKHIKLVEVTNSKGTHFRRRQLVGRKDDNEHAKKWLKNYKEKKSKEALNKQIDNDSKKLNSEAENHKEQVNKDLQDSLLNGEINYKTLDDNGKEAMSLDFEVKTSNSIKNKIKDNLSEGNKYDDASKLTDILRYTDKVQSNDDIYQEYLSVKNSLQEKGYEEIRVRNTLNDYSYDKPYRGLNTLYNTPDGYTFELQFHSDETLSVKEKVHAWYKELHNVNTSTENKKIFKEKIYNEYKQIENIKYVDKIKSYSK